MRTMWFIATLCLSFLCLSTIAEGKENVIEVYVNNEAVKFDSGAPFIAEGTTMVPVRFIAEALGAQVDWDSQTHTVSLSKQDININLTINQKEAVVNGQSKRFTHDPVIRNNRTYVPLRFISEELRKDVEWEPNQRMIFISQSKHESDVYWLAKLVEAEAADEPYEGKVAVAAVVLNRTQSVFFPKTIKSVIFESSQFTPVQTKRIFKMDPKPETVRAVEEAMAGGDPTKGALYFYNPRKTNNRFLHSRTITMTIGNHRFVT
ncbi:stalk domain-containing protein [Ammoniphilus sp. YIM 78166]|uniref:stalk domain-containing protein n=1 Tax=Ammoniphilus sp. YIM 78166 TaxID=1644106 RepID=UPI001431A42A|nr:stalk domain-containing protein [Ammoniphilus sp. YIM 78166]